MVVDVSQELRFGRISRSRKNSRKLEIKTKNTHTRRVYRYLIEIVFFYYFARFSRNSFEKLFDIRTCVARRMHASIFDAVVAKVRAI